MSELQGLKVAILVADGFEQIELEQPKQALEKAGAQTILVSPEKQQVQGWHHTEKGSLFDVDLPLDDAKAQQFDALLLPGGVHNPDYLRTLNKAISFVKEIAQQNKPIAAICHGPWLLINAGVAQNRKITSWPSLEIDLRNAGAQWRDEAVVIDKNLVTSRKPQDIPKFNEAMLQLFESYSKNKN
ncbi:intracellular protease, ThiJ/PfpI family [Legionella beliardensis]|uniref:Intracellular protease, ThiJ/PfpI family n=1 Tax=Legionella beliardensis TaxID=91822 RepID=A0A378HYI5_9GAMM|nr:type 1 glutamine amidotransferase domain-containing protein [Legionella beliardensis]STX27959.1 intracellular protease, ThiJ/PfpI family [Legionella beliardensis]